MIDTIQNNMNRIMHLKKGFCHPKKKFFTHKDTLDMQEPYDTMTN